MKRRDAAVAGVDGCRGGWVVISGTTPRMMRCAVITHLADLPADLAVIAIDTPIGLSATGPRGCDRAARARLNGAARAAGPGEWVTGAAVFPAPARAALDARTHAEANRLNRMAGGPGLPLQTFHILPKIREADALRSSPPAGARIVEGHPELSYLAQNGGRALPRKTTRDGIAARDGLLLRAGITNLPDWLKGHPRRLHADIRDAAVLWLTARRMADGTVERLPVEPEIAVQGWPMAIHV